MIGSYGERQNPCTFCAEGDDNVSTTNKEYLEFSLCGNDTTLFVREVSVDDLTKPNEDDLVTDEANEITVPPITRKTPPVLTSETSARNNRGPNPTRASPTQHRLDALYTKKWSGNTYFEEEIRRLRDQQYEKNVKQALKMRRLWKRFQIEILRDRRRDLVKSSGPEWWQEPSTKQIVLATTLRDVIKADYEEEVTGRTRQWMLDLGVTTRLTPKQVRRCMKRSLLEPVDFLLEAHAQIVKSQQSEKKKGDLQRPFSVDERLLLTAVCVLQLPTLLTMLHYMLPPPKPYPVEKHVRELLYGDLDDETIRYSTPYMEPLPFRNKVDFEDWAFEKICSALLPILLQDGSTGTNVRASNISEKITSDLKRSLSLGSQPHIQNNRLSVYSVAPSITLLLSYCLSKRKQTDSMRVNLDDESVGRRRTFGRRLTQFHSKLAEAPKGEQGEIPVLSSMKSLETESPPAVRETTPTVLKKEKTSPLPSVVQGYYEEYNWANQPWQGEYTQPTKDYVYPYTDQPYYGNNYYDEQTNYYDSTEYQKYQDSRTATRAKTVETVYSKTSSKLTLEVTHSDSVEPSKSFLKEEEASESLNQLKNIWEEIGACPEKEQLQKAMKILTEMGDPLAQLPSIEKLPAIQRWLELRRGKNRILSKATKLELLNQSRGMWKSVNFSSMKSGPKIEISKAEERKLTWDRKKWLESEIRREKRNYFTTLKQEKVDNARAFFPTMLNHYDYGSKLNRNFRDVYFTYLPAREADTFAYRPWQPQESGHSKK